MPPRLQMLNGGASREGEHSHAPESRAQMRERYVELAQRVAMLTVNLGGLTYEMARRDHYRLDVLSRRAAELQQADAELGAIERALGSAEAGVQGQCRSCGAVYSRGASFCWHCGTALQHEARPEQVTQILPPVSGS